MKNVIAWVILVSSPFLFGFSMASVFSESVSPWMVGAMIEFIVGMACVVSWAIVTLAMR